MEDGAVRFKFSPYFELAVALDETKGWVKFEVGFEVAGEEKLDLHGSGASVEENDLLSVELLVHHHIHIVLLFFHVDGNVHTLASQLQGNRLCVVLVVEE